MALLEFTICSVEEARKSILALNPPKLFKEVSYSKVYEDYLLRNSLIEDFFDFNDPTNIIVADMKFIDFSKELEELNILADKIKEEES